MFEDESRYQFVRVTENDGVRRLYLNEGVAVHSVWRTDTVLTGGVWDTFLTVPLLLEREPAAGGDARQRGRHGRARVRPFYPATEVDGVEIDPAVTDVAFRWFGLGDNPRVDAYDEDARPFLRRTDARYDLVYVDAYHQPYVPFYLATKEFFELVRSRLRPGGLVALNVATVPGDRRLVDELSGTLASVFPEVRIWPVLELQPHRDRAHRAVRRRAPSAGRAARRARGADALAALGAGRPSSKTRGRTTTRPWSG